MRHAAIKVTREVPFGQENAGTVLSEDVIIVNSEHEMALKHGAEPLLTFKLLEDEQRHPGRTFPGIELRLTGPGGVIMQADSVRAHMIAKYAGYPENDGWTDVIGGTGDYPIRLVGDQHFKLEFRAVDLPIPFDEGDQGDDDEQESIAFDLTFDPAQLCAVCVTGLNPPNAAWTVRGINSDNSHVNMHGVETTVAWARALIARGGRIETPGGRILPLYAASLYRGTPLCEYDLTPAIMGQGPYKF